MKGRVARFVHLAMSDLLLRIARRLRPASPLRLRRSGWILAIASLVAACSSEGDYYSRCDSTSDCNSNLACYTVAFEVGRDGTMCSDSCVDDNDCPFGGACYELIGDPIEGQRICYDRCIAARNDCAIGFECRPTLDEADNPTGDAICLPTGR